MCWFNSSRWGKSEPAMLPGRYGRMYWGWRKYPFTGCQMCWELIKNPKHGSFRRKGPEGKFVHERYERAPSMCSEGWALEKETGEICQTKAEASS